ncbi:MAG: excinuclease ABC subunit UvrC [Acidimicrobiia bacterium]
MQRPAGTIPDAPGSYQFKDAHGRVIYVGKAASLRSRVSSYFADPRTLHPRTAAMVEAAATVEWIEVRNEVEALMLEYGLIKQHRPRFNVRLRDDKSYPLLAVTVDEEWPRAMVMRGRKRRGTRYFGPYAHAWAIRDTLDLLLRTFPVRTCSPAKYRQHERLGRPCLLYHIKKCAGPCVGAVSPEEYRAQVEGLTAFLDGDTEPITEALEAEMRDAASAQDYERAARARDRLGAVRTALERQQMVGERDEDVDVVGLAESELEAAVQVFHVRRGRVVGSHGSIVDKVEDVTRAGLLARVLEQMYGEAPVPGWPKALLVPEPPEGADALAAWLSGLRGSAVEIRVPQRGDKRALAETVAHNAAESLARHRARRASDHNSRSRALAELQTLLRLPEAPLRIECYDMAHLQGTDYVGSMVVLEDGLPARREYRRFKIRTVAGNDDYAAMREVLARRLRAYLAERDASGGADAPEAGAPSGAGRRAAAKFRYPPQLLLVDGGKGQLSVAVDVVRDLGLEDVIPVAALAKEHEEVFVPGSGAPVRVPRGSEALYMLQVVRDEAHRFANAFHRELRGRRMTRSELDGIPGLGPARRARLVAHFGGAAKVRAATLEQLLALGWLPDAVARAVHERLRGAPEAPPLA